MFKKKEKKVKVGRSKLADDITNKKTIIIVVVAFALVLGLLVGGIIRVIGNDSFSLMKGATSSNGYTVRFVKQGEGISGSMSNQVITKTTNLKNIQFKIEDGYKFRGYCAMRFSDSKTYGYNKKTGELGWYKSSDLGGCYYWQNNQKILLSLTTPGDTINLYATAVKKTSVKIKYTNSRAKNPGGFMAEQIYNYGSKLKISKVSFTNKDYVFKGWIIKRNSDGMYYSKKDGKIGWYKGSGISYIYAKDEATLDPNFVSSGETLVLYADWSKYITVKYTNQSSTGKNATGTMNDKIIFYGSNLTLDKVAYKNPGYTFKGWIVQRTQDGKYYGNKNGKTGWYKESGFSYILLKDGSTLSASFLKESIKENGTIKFYASWSKNSSSTNTTTQKNASNNKTTTKAVTTTKKATTTTTKKTTKNNSSGNKPKCSAALDSSACRFYGYTWKNGYCNCN